MEDASSSASSLPEGEEDCPSEAWSLVDVFLREQENNYGSMNHPTIRALSRRTPKDERGNSSRREHTCEL